MVLQQDDNKKHELGYLASQFLALTWAWTATYFVIAKLQNSTIFDTNHTSDRSHSTDDMST